MTSKEVIKIIVLGNSNVGKSSLIERFANDTFSGIRTPTVGADFFTKVIHINGTDVAVQIWDTAGLERFHHGSIGNAFYRGAHGCLLVYDVTSDNSLVQLTQWRAELLSKVGTEDFPLVIIANKVDLKIKAAAKAAAASSSSSAPSTATDEMPTERSAACCGSPHSSVAIVEWCQTRKYGHIEASAKDGLGVEAAIRTITALSMELKRTNPNYNMTPGIQSSSSSVGTRSQSVQLGTAHNFDKYEKKKQGCCG